MAVLDMFRRGWGWVWLLGLTELTLVGAQALPLLKPAPPRPTVPAPPTAPDSPARVSLQPILDFQPFGTPDTPPPAATPDTPQADTAPAAPLTEGYVLQGVLFRDDGVPSRAILAFEGDVSASYVTGDTLPSGATLAGIEANRVWLEKDGDKQFLEFPNPGSALPDNTTPDPTNPDFTDTVPATEDATSTDPTASDTTAQTPPPDPVQPDPAQPDPAQIVMPQPDLRNLIPGLTATQPSGN